MDKIYIATYVFLSIGFLIASAKPTPRSYWLEKPNKEMQNLDYIYEDERYYDKRGFSMLARWRPFNIIGKQRTSIRDLVPLSKYDVVSAETRGFSRPSGQPLRWG